MRKKKRINNIMYFQEKMLLPDFRGGFPILVFPVLFSNKLMVLH